MCMLNITVATQPYKLPNSFSDFTVARYLECVKVFHLPLLDRVHRYTDIPVEVLNGLAVEHFNAITDVVAFIEKPELLLALSDRYMLPNDGERFEGAGLIYPKQVGEESFLKIEKAKKVYLDLSEVVKVYTGEDIANEPLLQHWAKCIFYKNSLEVFFERFKEMNAHEYTPDELEAGVETLTVFGYWPIVFRIAKERSMTNDQVLDMTANEVYMQLLFEYRANLYADNLRRQAQEEQELANQANAK